MEDKKSMIAIRLDKIKSDLETHFSKIVNSGFKKEILRGSAVSRATNVLFNIIAPVFSNSQFLLPSLDTLKKSVVNHYTLKGGRRIVVSNSETKIFLVAELLEHENPVKDVFVIQHLGFYASPLDSEATLNFYSLFNSSHRLYSYKDCIDYDGGLLLEDSGSWTFSEARRAEEFVYSDFIDVYRDNREYYEGLKNALSMILKKGNIKQLNISEAKIMRELTVHREEVNSPFINSLHGLIYNYNPEAYFKGVAFSLADDSNLKILAHKSKDSLGRETIVYSEASGLFQIEVIFYTFELNSFYYKGVLEYQRKTPVFPKISPEEEDVVIEVVELLSKPKDGSHLGSFKSSTDYKSSIVKVLVNSISKKIYQMRDVEGEFEKDLVDFILEDKNSTFTEVQSPVGLKNFVLTIPSLHIKLLIELKKVKHYSVRLKKASLLNV